jgi:hypothetical protein
MTETIDTLDKLLQLADECEGLSLGDGSPKKSQVFYLYRGLNRHSYKVLSSIQVECQKLFEKRWKQEVGKHEKHLVNRFLKEVEPFRELHDQYHWYSPPCPKTDTFWYLSVMQHFGCPTRLCDFTADFWMAVFFAVDGATENSDSCICRIKCKNEDSNNTNGNKLPKDVKGASWPSCDINEMLGYLIGYECFERADKAKAEWLNELKAKDSQRYGWDAPWFKNGRVRKQRGYFVYPVDVTVPLEESLSKDRAAEFTRYRLTAGILLEIKNELCKRGLIGWKVYLDLDRAFRQWKDEGCDAVSEPKS